ncbi:MAG: hypothetical protein L0Y44_16365 [Phycisphaerales bacterium]|nr:hypothetical protein [Phycisphaerales bacterium]
MATSLPSNEAALVAVEAEMERIMSEMDALSAQASKITERYAEFQAMLAVLTDRRSKLRREVVITRA